MKENQVYKSLSITILLFASLCLAILLPGFKIAGYEFKRIDLFADLRIKVDKNDLENSNLLAAGKVFDTTYLPYLNSFTDHLIANEAGPVLFPKDKTVEKSPLVIRMQDVNAKRSVSLPEITNGVNFIEDFATEKSSLELFFKALNEVKQGSGKARIAMFGDSFIEGDIFCADVRNTLQDLFGGNGVGFVPVTSEVAQFRNTIGHTFTGFQSFSVVKKTEKPEPYGAAGLCFIPQKNNELVYTAIPNYKHLKTFHDIRIFYAAPENEIFSFKLDAGEPQELKVKAAPHIHQAIIRNSGAKSVKISFPASDTLKLYGVSFEDSTGIYVDNFGLRGNSGLLLNQISEPVEKQFNNLQNYQLVILQYGLNVVAPDSKELNWYVNPMVGVVEKVKRCFPGASILLLGVSDRSTKVDGEYQTMESIPVMIQAQRQIAKKTEVAFFNLFEAMGGKNSMVAYVDSDPPLANKDYTHLTFQGGKRVAGIFVNSLLNEYQKYNEKVKNQATAVDNRPADVSVQ